MAAQEYYQSFQQVPQHMPPPPYPSTPPPQSGGGTPRPYAAPVQSPHNYSPMSSAMKPQQQYLQVPGHQPSPQPWNQQPSYGSYQGTQQEYGLVPSRSHSEPPEHRRPSNDSRHSSRHHHHRHDRDSSSSRSRSRSRSRGFGSRSRSRSRHHSHHHSHSRKRSHSGRDTFLGAGAGGIIGDAILPGLGTLVGAIAGGAGGHSYAHHKDRREARSHSDSGYRDGITVKSGWIRR